MEDKILDIIGKGKTTPKSSEQAQSEKHGKKKNDKDKIKTSKGSEDHAIQADASKEKNPISCWICAKEHLAKNFPLK
jgi:hypothetical protein